MPGGISPRRKQTALNLKSARTPRDLSAAMFAQEPGGNGQRAEKQERSTPTYGDWVVDVFRFDNVVQKH